MTRELETFRGFVYPWTIDHVGHMNVQFYVARFDEASWHFLAHLGLGPTFLKENERGMAALDQRVHYRREVHAGSLIDIRTRLLEVGNKTLRFQHTMRNSETEEEVAAMDLVAVYLDTRARKGVPFPDRVRARASEWMQQ